MKLIWSLLAIATVLLAADLWKSESGYGRPATAVAEAPRPAGNPAPRPAAGAEDGHEGHNHDTAGLIEQAQTLVAAGSLDEALTLLNQAIAHQTNDPDLLVERAKVFQQLGRSNEAIADVSFALQLRPDDLQWAREVQELFHGGEMPTR